jgi:hypothetical protein
LRIYLQLKSLFDCCLSLNLVLNTNSATSQSMFYFYL